jgi:hypothetical protein
VAVGAFGVQVCPYLHSLGPGSVVVVLGCVFGVLVLLRSPLEQRFVTVAPALDQPGRQLLLDLGLFLVAGLAVTIIDRFAFGFPLGSGLRLGVSTTGEDKGIQKPYGNPANYLSVIIDDFDRAGEDAWMIGVSQDFGRLGKGDLSLFANVVQGNTPDSGPVASPDETEYDLTVDYRMKEGWTDTLWFRVRAAYIDEDERTGGDDYFDFRIIVNYSFDLTSN